MKKKESPGRVSYRADISQKGPDYFKKLREFDPAATIKIPQIYHTLFFAIAKNQLEEAIKIPSFREGKDKGNRVFPTDEIDFKRLTEIKDNPAAIICIVFSALTLEAFINWYGAAKIGKEYFREHLDRLKVEAKWEIIPRLVTGKSIETGANAPFERFKSLIKLRNDLVHYKSVEHNVEKIIYAHWVDQDEAKEAIATTVEMIKAILRIDQEIKPEYLEGMI